MMYDHEKSDPAIVAVKPTNKAGQPAAELVEPRAGAEGNVRQQSTGRAQYRVTVSQALEQHTEFREKYHDAPLHTRGGSRVPELGSHGSVRGARGNSRPYRERHVLIVSSSGLPPNRTLHARRQELWYPPSNAMGRSMKRRPSNGTCCSC